MSSRVTFSTLTEGLARSGLAGGSVVLVHCSLSSMGRVQGGAQTLIEALTTTVSETGTLAMDAFSEGRFDPSEWGNPPADESDWDRLRFDVPLYDPAKTPTDSSMSRVNELFRTWPGTWRSNHPHTSFAVWGSGARQLLQPHYLDNRLGDTSPLARLYDLNARVLFIGTGYDTNTAFHLAEYRQTTPPRRTYLSVLRESEMDDLCLDKNLVVKERRGGKVLVEYADVDTNSSRFQAMGEAFEKACDVHLFNIGAADCRVFALPDAVDFGVRWLNGHG